jgi:hypothetical protein
VSGAHKYIYGVIGDESREAVQGLAVPDGVYAVPYRDIFAVISDSEVADYAGLPGDVAARYLVGHQAVIEKVMEKCTIVPMRPGTIMKGEGEVAQVLNTGYHMFKDVLEKIRGRMELDITVTWADMGRVIREVSGEDEVSAFKQELLKKIGGVTIDDQMKMGMLIEARLNGRKKECTEAVKETLKDLCRNMKEYPVADAPTIMSAAFFLDNHMSTPFEERLEALSERLGGAVRFKCIGPLPPYNFHMIEVKRFRYEDIDRARKRLALGDFATRDDIKKAYRNLAFLSHPDRRPEEAAAEKEYMEVTKAYELLSEYCQDDVCSFGEEDFARNSVIARVWEQ